MARAAGAWRCTAERNGQMTELDEQYLKGRRILIIDDEEANVLLLRRILEVEGYISISFTTDPFAAAGMFERARPDLVLLDLQMPGIDGLELMRRLDPPASEEPAVPFIVLTADVTEETKLRALRAGARDFLTKPLGHAELLVRVRNTLQVKCLQDRLHRHNTVLSSEVAVRTRDLEEARLEILDRLALAAEYRDDDTQEHAWRIGRICGLLARGLGLPVPEAEMIERAALLHDIGKIGISDAVLLKPGRLTAEEFEQVKTHPAIGAAILAGSRSPVLRTAEVIALTHHERWDGSGYPHGLAGERIPLVGRITAVADVFDALAHRRPYKEAWPLPDAVAEIINQRGRQFDAEVVAVFSLLEHETLLTSIPRAHGPNGRSLRPAATAVTTGPRARVSRKQEVCQTGQRSSGAPGLA